MRLFRIRRWGHSLQLAIMALLMSVMLAPITKFVRTLAEPHSKLVRTVAAIRDQKQQAA